MKGKGLFRTSLVILRALRALAVAAIMIIIIATVSKAFGYKTIYVDELRGKLNFAIPNVISFGAQTIAIKTTLQLEDIVMLNQIAQMISDEPKRISPFFETETRILNLSPFQLSLAIINLLIKALAYFFAFHFMIKIMKNVIKDEVFNLQNNFYLKVIAAVIMVAPLVYSILETINISTLKNYLLFNGRGENNLMVYVRNWPNFEPLIFIAVGGFVYLLAKIQEYGLKLKQENDLTV